MKNGLLTTEFWAMFAGQVIAILVALHVIDPAKQAGLQDATTSLVQSMFALVSSLMLIRSYIYSRTTIKAAALANASLKARCSCSACSKRAFRIAIAI